MINNIRIQNFKCWKDTGIIDLAPITIFFGANSSGKSSIGQFLMMLKQSVESSDRKTVFQTGNDMTPVDVGSPIDFIYDKNIENHINFMYEWKPAQPLEIRDAYNKIKETGETFSFFSDIGLVGDGHILEVEKFGYRISKRSGGELDFTLQKKGKVNGSKKKYELISDTYKLERQMGRPWDITTPVRFYGFPDEAIAYYRNVDFLQSINLRHEDLFTSMYYLGPLRNKAKRIYTWTGGIPRDVGSSGEETISALLAAKEDKRQIGFKARGRQTPLEVVIAKMLKKMSLVEDFKIERISEKRQDFEVKVRTSGSRNYVDIPDVGVGVSQVLPVLVELFFAPPESVIVMEQPELHLHPSAQAGLADVVIDAIHSKQGGKNRNIQLIIETHSEHFLRRLQRRLAEEKIRESELSGYFIDSIRGKALMKQLVIDSYGDIVNWPKNFFGNINEDIMIQAETAVGKRVRETKR